MIDSGWLYLTALAGVSMNRKGREWVDELLFLDPHVGCQALDLSPP